MARPKKLGLDYFAHDCDASNDEKIEGLRALYGNDGYAFYFILLERIYRTEKFELDLSNQDMKIILSRKIEIQTDKFEKILKSALNLGCFDKEAFENRHILTSNGIKKRAEIVVEKRIKMQQKYKQAINSKGKKTADTLEEITKETSTGTTTDIEQHTVQEIPTDKPERSKSETTIETDINSPKNATEIPQKTLEETTSEAVQSKVKQNKSKVNNNLLNDEKDDNADFKNKVNLVIKYFISKCGRKSIDKLDLECTKELAKYIDIDTIKAGIDTAFKRFKPKFKGDNIKTFRYCKSTILEIHNSKSKGDVLDGRNGRFGDSGYNKQDTITEIIEKYGITAAGGEIQDFKCQL
jgi:hypothetical protein